MANIYVKSGGGTIGNGDWRGVWSASQTWAVGDRVVATNVTSYRVMECTTGGAGGAGAEPTWNTTTGGTTNDNVAVWTTRIPDTWANATTTLARAAANDAAGDVTYVSDNHAESTAAAVVLDWAGNAAGPTKVICGDDSAEPPTAVANTATIDTTGNNSITISGTSSYAYVYGLNFTSAATGSGAWNTRGPFLHFDTCTFYTAGGSSAHPRFSTASCLFDNCGFKFANSGQRLEMTTNGFISFVGGSILSGGSAPLNLIAGSQSQGSIYKFDGFDFSNCSSSFNITSVATNALVVQLRDCKLPASWSGSLAATTPGPGALMEMFNCDSGDTNYKYRRATQFGTMRDETTLVRTGGASNGVTSYSYQMATNGNAEYPSLYLASPEIVKYNTTTGSAITATVEILRDSATNLTDADIWLEVMYLGTSGNPLGSFIDDSKADVLATATDQATSSATWTTTGMANPNEQKLSVTFTPQEVGFIHAVVKVAAQSVTLYIDPKITIT